MVLSAHDNILGWIHGLKLNNNNWIFGGGRQNLQSPYPPIIRNPNFTQAIHNWNIADTSLLLFVLAIGTVTGFRSANHHTRNIASYFQRKTAFYTIINYSFLFGFFFGLRNSIYRLQGLVPNGLSRIESDQPVKYDYTTEFLKKSFWGYFIQPNKKPSAEQ